MYHFNDNRKEVSFDKSNTPTPWMNYLSNGEFTTMISQAGGGVAFYKSPQIWRINHYRFFHLPTDRSGFYTYIKDGKNFWCPTAEPAKSRPRVWKATHGMGYTTYEAKRGGLFARARYFVGEYENCLIWNLKLRSKDDRKITVFPFVELGMMEFQRELQWQCYNKHQLSVYNMDDILVYKYGVEMQPRPEQTPLVYFASDYPATAFDCDRDEFIGSYASEENPKNVVAGKSTNSTLAGGDPCFALQLDIELKAGEDKEINIFLGTAMTEEDIKKSVAHCREAGFVKESLDMLRRRWRGRLARFQCEVPDENVQRMVNIWNPYQAERNFMFSRNISYYATGTFRGVGYRDTAQDILAEIPFSTTRAKDKIRLLLGQQYRDGHVNHYFFPTEGFDPVTTIHSDDHLWIIMSVYYVTMETGQRKFLRERVPYYDGGGASVYEHLKKSVRYTCQHLGEHGFPLMLRSDWNDMLYKVCREGKGESIWTSMQFGTVLRMMAELAELMGDDATEYRKLYDEQKKLVNEIAWDGEWFRRCITDDGTFIGSKEQPQAKIWLNTQSWSVISGMGDPDKAEKAMESVNKYLDTELGIKKIEPSMKDYPSAEDPLTYYNKGCGENGSVFCHANTWAIIAECMLGHPERAYKYYHQLLPMVAQEKAGEWRYKAEPYVYSSNIFGPESDKFGLANVSWLTGTAAWMYIAVTQYIFGVKASWGGLVIKPCIPGEWKHVTVKRTFRGCKYTIEIENKGVGAKEVVVPHVSGRTRCKVKVVV